MKIKIKKKILFLINETDKIFKNLKVSLTKQNNLKDFLYQLRIFNEKLS